MQKLVCSFRPLLCRAAPTDVFRTLLQNGILTWARPLAPLPEILVASAPIGEVRGQHSPLAPAFQEVQHPAENVIQVHGAGLGPTAGRLQHGHNTGELLPADVAGIGMRHDYPSPDNSLNLTYSRDRRQVLRGCLKTSSPLVGEGWGEGSFPRYSTSRPRVTRRFLDTHLARPPSSAATS